MIFLGRGQKDGYETDNLLMRYTSEPLGGATEGNQGVFDNFIAFIHRFGSWWLPELKKEALKLDGCLFKG
jgi:hypothetical protein